MSSSAKPKRVYRVDKFRVPDGARAEHLAGLHRTHDFLRTLEGFVQDLVIEKRAGPDAYNLITIVEWEDEASIQKAVAAAEAWRAGQGIVPGDRWKRLGIEAELGVYRTLTD